LVVLDCTHSHARLYGFKRNFWQGVRKEDVGESMNDLPWTLDNREGYANPNLIYYRIIYTLLFFCLITTILMNIIFGVIIDTFAELRSKKEQIDLDMSGRCFICGLDRFIFDEVRCTHQAR